MLYFEDHIIDDACPPLRAILHVMAHGHYNGKSIKDPDVRAMFTREALLKSNWYHARLAKKQMRDISLGKKNVAYLEEFLARPGYAKEAQRLGIATRLEEARKQLDYVSSATYLESLVGTLGADPIHDGYVMVDGSTPTDVAA